MLDELYVLDGNFKKIAVVDTYLSILWARRYQSEGEFELVVPADLAGDLVIGRFVGRGDDDGLMIIEQVKYDSDEDMGDRCTVTGRSWEALMVRRVIPYATTVYGTAEMAIRRLFAENMGEDAAVSRQMVFVSPYMTGYSTKVRLDFQGESLLDAVKKIASAGECGFRFVKSAGQYVLDVYEGTDNYNVIFSVDLDNVSRSTYTDNAQPYRNGCWVYSDNSSASYGFGILLVGTATGMELRETFAKADANISNSEMTLVGNNTLASAARVKDCDMDLVPVYTYGADYELGDKIMLKNEYGFQGYGRIAEVIEYVDEAGYRCIPSVTKISS